MTVAKLNNKLLFLYMNTRAWLETNAVLITRMSMYDDQLINLLACSDIQQNRFMHYLGRNMIHQNSKMFSFSFKYKLYKTCFC